VTRQRSCIGATDERSRSGTKSATACVQAPGNGSGVQAAGERRAARGGSPGAAGLDPCRDGLRVGAGLAAQLRGLPLERLAGLAFTGALQDPGDFGQQIGAPGGELAEFGHGGGFLGPGELPPPGVTSGCAGELGDEDPVRARSRAILIHCDRIEHQDGKGKDP
jgi:hypothetical protein